MGLQNTAVRISGYSSMKAYMVCISQFTKYKQNIFFSSLGNTLYFTTKMLAATLYQENTGRNHRLWDIVSTERYILHIFCWNVATYKCEVRNGKIVIISFVLNRPSLSMSRCRSRYDADLVVYVVFFISINQQCLCV